MKTEMTKAQREGVELDPETHFMQSTSLINRAAELADKRSALILGCGLCTEIPLKTLLHRFESVDLLDIDKWALQEISQQGRKWPTPLDPKRVHHADITGLVVSAEHYANTIAQGSKDPFNFLVKCAEWLNYACPEFWRPDQGKHFDLVIVSTVLTQLQALVRERIESVFSQYFPLAIQTIHNFIPWRTAIWQFARRLEHLFIRHLATLVKPEGVIYLSATVHVSWLTQCSANTFFAEGKWIATETNCLRDYLDQEEHVLQENCWDWIRPGNEGGYWGRLYGVQALIYQPQRNLVQA